MKNFLRIILITAALTAVMALSALADGWTQDSKGWQYLKNGSPVACEWQTDANGDYFYLGSDGYMVTNSFVDEDRFVDSTGRMVKNCWRQIDTKWYYFEATGRMVAGKKKLIENLWYIFDDTGAMRTGWYNDGSDWYYCDPNSGGHMAVSTWKKLEPAEDMASSSTDSATDGTYWFYFQASGKITRATEGAYKEAVIGGNRYAFDQCGRMQTGWVELSDEDPAIAGMKYYNDSEQLGTYGAAHVGWLSAYVPSQVSDSGEVQWYYFDVKGVPAYGEAAVSNGKKALKLSLKKITKNGTTYSYLFNDRGNPVYGLQRVILDDGTETSMYFGSKSQCCLQKNTTSVTEADGTVWKYLFTSGGYGYTGIKNRYLYSKGKLQKAVDETFAYYTVDGETYLVNQGGYVVYNYNKNKDPNEVEYRSDATGHRDGGTASVSRLLEPEYNDIYGD